MPDLTERFQLLVENKDGKISRAELDRMLAFGASDSAQAELLIALKLISIYKEAAEKQKDTDKKTDFVSAADVAELEEHLAFVSSDLEFQKCDDIIDWDKPIVPLQDNEEGVNFDRIAEAFQKQLDLYSRISSQNLYLYKDNSPLQSIVPDAIMQGRAGNCVFLAALGAIANKHPEGIFKIIKDCGDGTYEVTFPGYRQSPITVKQPTALELSLFARWTDYGFWPAVVEKAWGRLMQEMSLKPQELLAENTGSAQYWLEIFKILSGQSGEVVAIDSGTNDKVAEALRKAQKEQRYMTAWSNDSYFTDRSVTYITKIPTNHAYTILHFDEETMSVSLRNPWGGVPGSEPPDDEGGARDGELDGRFTLSWAEFQMSFEYVLVEQWADQTQDSFGALSMNSGSSDLLNPKQWFWIRMISGWTLIMLSSGLLWATGNRLVAAGQTWFFPSVHGKFLGEDESVKRLTFQNSGGYVDLQYEYEVNGTRYIEDFTGNINDLALNVDALGKGMTVNVFYNPKDPADSVLVRGPAPVFATTMVLLAAIFGLCFICGVGTLLNEKFFDHSDCECHKN